MAAKRKKYDINDISRAVIRFKKVPVLGQWLRSMLYHLAHFMTTVYRQI